MSEERVRKLRELLAKAPNDSMTRYMLANELFKSAQYEEAADELEAYVGKDSDEGAAYRLLAEAYRRLNRLDEARWALRKGIDSARSHHHDGMADELEDRLKDLG
ncbi:MAG TPA: tetratricopeptide repeat protein [Vicinamibacteria bacterium]|nr:tetratricopeptide repeat protein [Vicinamibacteria bacterium]